MINHRISVENLSELAKAGYFTFAVGAVPEPGTFALLGMAAMVLLRQFRRFRGRP